MGGKANSLLVGALVALIALGLAACGGGDETSAGGGDQANATAAGQGSTEKTDDDGGKPEAGDESKAGTNSGDSDGQESSPDSGGGESGSGEAGDEDSNSSGNGGGSDGNGKKTKNTDGPLEKAGEKESAEIREFGTITDDSEMQAAHEVLITYSRAFSRKDWTVACSTLSKELIVSLGQLAKSNPEIKGTSCVAAFSYAGEQLGVLPNLGTEIADPLDGFQVEGNNGWAIYGGEAFAMPMTREGGEWKLNAFEPKKLT